MTRTLLLVDLFYSQGYCSDFTYFNAEILLQVLKSIKNETISFSHDSAISVNFDTRTLWLLGSSIEPQAAWNYFTFSKHCSH